MPKANVKNAVKGIEKYGILLAFPISNNPEPLSLWSYFYPQTKMRWEWDEDMNESVHDLWHLREKLSRSGKVVYAKWYQNRATFFSKALFTAWLSGLHHGRPENIPLSEPAKLVLATLEEDSPLSSKELKKRVKKEHGLNTKPAEKAIKELWNALLIVGYGEVDDGAFPSLAVGATRLMFEDLWKESIKLTARETQEIFKSVSIQDTKFYAQLQKVSKHVAPGPKKVPARLTFEELSRYK